MQGCRRALALALQISQAKLYSHIRTSVIIFFSHCPIFIRSHIVQRLVWSFIVVVVAPGLSLQPHLIDGSEDVSIQNRPAVAAVEALDITVLCRTSRLRIQQSDIVSSAPFLELLRDELRAVIATSVARLAIQPYHFLKHLDDPLTLPSWKTVLCQPFDVDTRELRSQCQCKTGYSVFQAGRSSV